MRTIFVALILCMLLDGCALTHRMHRHHRQDVATSATGLPQLATAEVPEAFVGDARPARGLDSLSSWLAADGSTWVIATANKSDQLIVFDGDSGKRLRTFGASGDGPGQFRFPSGLAAFADLLFVVERDNHRVQVLQLPDFKSLGSFGSEQLRNPSGIWLHETAPDEYEVLVTDQYPVMVSKSNHLDGKKIPPLAQLDQRVKHYRVRMDDGVLHADYAGAFGDITAAGALRGVQSIAGDEDNNRIAIAETERSVGTRLRMYAEDGRYTGTDVGAAQYHAQAAGIALFSCPDGSGYWIGVDRYAKRSAFLVFDRKSLAYVGAFAGKTVANTAGLVLQPASTAHFPDGALYAVSEDSTIAAFDWREIKRALELKPVCEP